MRGSYRAHRPAGGDGHPQHTAIERGAAAVSVLGGEDQRAAGLCQAAGAGDRAAGSQRPRVDVHL